MTGHTLGEEMTYVWSEELQDWIIVPVTDRRPIVEGAPTMTRWTT